MAFINFTNSPSDGDTFTSNGVTFTYSTSKGRWKAGSAGSLLTAEGVQDITGAMFTGNTETGITATYEDSDGTIDLAVSAASSAATLTTARNINGVSFDGSADITLPAEGTDWDTTLKTSAFTGVSGKGYLLNTTAGAVTVTLPASPSAGNTVDISDAVGKAHVNKITIARNGSNIYAAATDIELTSKRGNISLIYTDATNGWVSIDTVEVLPSYILTGSANNVNEGVALTVSLATVNVSNGTLVPYTITGVTSADLGGVSLTGNFTISSNTATATFTPTEDTTTEGAETMVLTLDGTSVALSTTINDTSFASNPMVGDSYGYQVSGQYAGPLGYSKKKEKYSFTSNGNSTGLSDLSQRKRIGTGFNSSTNGYTSGGLDDAGSGSVYATGSKWAFSNDNNISTGYGTVSFASAGSSTGDAGYAFGGYRRTNTGTYSQADNGAASSVIEKQTFSNDNIANSGVSALHAKGYSSCSVSSSHIYAAHGLTNNVLQKFPFAASSGTCTAVGDMVNSNFASSGNTSDTKGYASGGASPYSNLIQSYPFSTDSNATDVGDLLAQVRGTSGSNSGTKGYKHGGNLQYTPWFTNVIQSFPFASEGNSSDVGDLTVASSYTANGNIQV